MGGFSVLGFDPAAFEPVEPDAVGGRDWLSELLAADAMLSGWTHYTEPPEHLAAGPSVVIVPRSPYISWGTYRTGSAHMTIQLCVPRAHGPAMDLLEDAIGVTRAVLETQERVDMADTIEVAMLEDVGGAAYIVASLNVTIT